MLPLLLALQAVPGPPASAPRDSLGGPGVSRALADYRAHRIADVRYALALDVTGRDSAPGAVTIRFRRRGDGDAILDWRGLALGAATVNGRLAPGVRGDGAHVRIPSALLRAGENVVALPFVTAIAPAGASVIRFHDPVDGSDYLYTLLVPADAEALFPCFDQPDLKARVALTLREPAAWTAVANGAVASERMEGSARVVRFAETRPISTYLVAFAAGPWATVRETIGGRTLTMYARRSRVREAEADSLIRANAAALDWLGRYFERPYPFGKFDFVLAPAFPFGGMEHPGAVFYNEESFIYRERPTLPQRLGRTATIYHEVAHQWFGDLVTMRWFDDLWLKEGFATYMAAKMQDALDPASQAWKTFYLRNKPTAYAVDASLGTTPIWQSLENLDQAKSNYGAIVYNKAPAVLKQLNYLVGDGAFRLGLQRYLAAHAYGNATWQDLLGAVGGAAGRDLEPFGRAYILRPGIPLLEASPARDGADVRAVRLRQRPAQALSGPGAWPIRLELLVRSGADGAVERLPVELRGADTTVSLPTPARAPALLFPNAADEAYAITLLDTASVRWTETRLPGVEEPFLRAMLWGALWDQLREARYAPARFIALAEDALPHERDEQIVPFVLARVTRAATRYLSRAQQDSVLPTLERVLLAGADDSTRAYGYRKAHLDAAIAVAATPATLTRLDALLDSSRAAGAPLGPPTRWAIVTRLVETGATGAEGRLAAETRRDSTTEGRRRAFAAGAARPDCTTKRDYFARYFTDRSLNEEWATASLGAFNAVRQDGLTAPYVVPALDSLPWIQRHRRIFYLGAWVDAYLGGQTSPEALQRVDAWLAAHPRLPADLRQKVLQGADELRRTVAIRRAWAGDGRAAADR